MLNINVDEGYAFDYLTILSLKFNKNTNNEDARRAYTECYANLQRQIGDDLWEEILNSIELVNLYDANSRTFDVVEKARYGSGGEVTAKDVDDANMDRYWAKVALQKKFFGTKILEQKT